jgi:hypothetical protein
MSIHDLLTLIAAAALIVLSTAVHSPFVVNVAPVLASAGAH